MDTTQDYKETKLIALNSNAIRGDTADWLRSFKGCEHYNDTEAFVVLTSLDILATILLGNALYKIRNIDNQQVVSLIEQEKFKNRAA